MGSRRDWVAAVAVVFVVAGGVISVAPSAAADPIPAAVLRYAGPDRFATSAAVSAATFPTGVQVAYITSGEDFADALAVGPIAGRQGAPVLTVLHEEIPASVAAELHRLDPGRIVVVGGPAAVSDSVLQALTAYTSGGVTRIAGLDRYATAAALSADTFAPGVQTVFLASGESFPDALAAGPVAARDAAPILLTTAAHVPAATEAELARLHPQQVIVVGGSSAISQASLTNMLGSPATTNEQRIAGADRFETAVDLARMSAPVPSGTVFVASGLEFADAEAAVPAAARQLAPILLSLPGCLPGVVEGVLAPPPSNVILVGGPSAVSDGVGQLQPCRTTVVTATAAPDTGLTDGQTIKVSGAGFPSAQPLIAIECNGDPAIAPNGNGCDIPDSQDVTASPDGTVGPTTLTVRTGQLGSDPRSTCPPSAAQIAAGITCKAVIATFDGAVAASHTITFAPAGPPAVLSAVPATSLSDGDAVTVSGADFPASQTLTVAECSGTPGIGGDLPFKPGLPFIGYPGPPSACDSRTITAAPTDTSGHFGPVQVVVHTGRFGGGATACPPTSDQQQAGITTCDLVVTGSSGRTLATATLGFTSTQTGPARPTVTVTPATGLRDGDTVTVTAAGFTPYTLVTVGECSPAPSGFGVFYYPGGCLDSYASPWVTTDQNGAIGPITIPVHVEAQYVYGTGPAPVLTACPPTSEQQQAGIGACVISVTAVNGGMAADAPIAFAAGTTAPLPPAPPSSPMVQITQVVRPGDLTPNTGEHVVLTNTDPLNAVTVGNWSILDLAGNRLLIGPGYAIAPGGSLSVYTGTGSDTPDAYFNGITVSILDQPVEQLTLYTDSGQPVSTYTHVTAPTGP